MNAGESTWAGRKYLAALGQNMRDLFMEHQDIMVKDPRINVEDVMKVGPTLLTTLGPVNKVV
jgi:hypothetical protein